MSWEEQLYHDLIKIDPFAKEMLQHRAENQEGLKMSLLESFNNDLTLSRDPELENF